MVRWMGTNSGQWNKDWYSLHLILFDLSLVCVYDAFVIILVGLVWLLFYYLLSKWIVSHRNYNYSHRKSQCDIPVCVSILFDFIFHWLCLVWTWNWKPRLVGMLNGLSYGTRRDEVWKEQDLYYKFYTNFQELKILIVRFLSFHSLSLSVSILFETHSHAFIHMPENDMGWNG